MTDFKKLRVLTPEEAKSLPKEKPDPEYIRRNTTEPQEIANESEPPVTRDGERSPLVSVAIWPAVRNSEGEP